MKHGLLYSLAQVYTPHVISVYDRFHSPDAKAVMHSEKFQPASLNKLITYTYNIKNDAAYLATQIFRFRWM